jgi:hypothetical protein
MNLEGLTEKGMRIRTEQGSKANQRAVDETQGQQGAEPEVQRWTVKRRTILPPLNDSLDQTNNCYSGTRLPIRSPSTERF